MRRGEFDGPVGFIHNQDLQCTNVDDLLSSSQNELLKTAGCANYDIRSSLQEPREIGLWRGRLAGHK